MVCNAKKTNNKHHHHHLLFHRDHLHYCMEVSGQVQAAIRLLPGECGLSFTCQYSKSRNSFYRTHGVSQTPSGCAGDAPAGMELQPAAS